MFKTDLTLNMCLWLSRAVIRLEMFIIRNYYSQNDLSTHFFVIITFQSILIIISTLGGLILNDRHWRTRTIL